MLLLDTPAAKAAPSSFTDSISFQKHCIAALLNTRYVLNNPLMNAFNTCRSDLELGFPLLGRQVPPMRWHIYQDI